MRRIKKAHTLEDMHEQADILSELVDEYGHFQFLADEQFDIIVANFQSATKSWGNQQALLHRAEQKLEEQGK